MADGSVSVKVNVDDKDAQKELARLEKNMEKTVNKMSDLSAKDNGVQKQLEDAGAAAERAQAKVDDLRAKLEELQNMKSGATSEGMNDPSFIEKFMNSYGQEEDLSSQLKEAEAELKAQSDQVSKLSAQHADLQSKIQAESAEYERQKEQIGDIQAQMVQSSGGKGVSMLREKAASVAGVFKNGLKSVLGWGAGIAAVGKSKIFDRIKAGVDNANKGFQLGAKQILAWGIGITSVAALLKKMKSFLSEGIKKYMEFDPTTKANVDALKASLESLKVSWGAAFAPVINAVIPILQAVIGWLRAAAEAVAAFFAILSGASSYKRVISNNNALAESYGGAGAAAEEAQKQIMGFDEINKLNDSSSGGGGGGGGAAGLQFEDVDIGGEFLDQLKAAIDAGDWAQLGTLLGEKVNELFDSVDWESVGRKFGQKIGAVITTAYYFMKTVDFKGIGQHIGTMLANAFDEINFNDLGGLLVRRFTAVWDFFIGVLTAPGFAAELATALSDTMIGALTEFASWLESLEPREILDALKAFIGNIKWGEIGAAFVDVLKKAWGLAKDLGGEIFFDFGTWFEEKFGVALSEVDWKAIHNILNYSIDKAVFGEGWANFWWSKGDYAGKEIVQGMMDSGLGTDIENLVNEDVMHPLEGVTFDSIIENLKGWQDAYEEHKASTKGWKSSVSGDAKDAANEAKSAADDIGSSFTEVPKTLSEHIEETKKKAEEGGVSVVKAFWDSMKERWGSFGDSWLGQAIQKIKDWFTGLKSDSSDAETVVAEGVEHIGANLLDLNMFKLDWAGLSEGAGEQLGALKEKVSGIVTGIKDFFLGTTEEMTTTGAADIQGYTEEAGSIFETLSETVSTIFGSVRDFFLGTSGEMKDQGIADAQELDETVSSEYKAMDDSIVSSATETKTTIATLWGEIKTQVAQRVTDMKNNVNTTMTGIHSQTSSNISKIKSLMNFSWSLPKPKMPHISWTWEDVGGLLKLPRFSISWYAKGGIFDAASLIGVGEKGREAVLPLENNTGWIKDLANQILDAMESRYSGAMKGLPAMAMGQVAPPMAVAGSSSAIDESELARIIASALGAANQSRQSEDRPIYIQIDGKTLAKTTTKYQNQIARAYG